MNRENQFKFANNSENNYNDNKSYQNYQNFNKNQNYGNKNNFDQVNNLLIDNYSINELCAMVIHELNIWHYYNTVIKDFSINRYSECFGETVNMIYNIEDKIAIINEEISNKINNYSKTKLINLKSNHYKTNNQTFKDFTNFNTNNLVDNIISKFRVNANSFNIIQDSNQDNNYDFNNLIFFNTKNIGEKEIKSMTNTLYKNLVKILHPDGIDYNNKITNFFNEFGTNKNESIIYKMNNNKINSQNLNVENLFILLSHFHQDKDIYRMTALDTITSIILNPKYQINNNFVKKTVFLLNFLNKENTKFIQQEPYCFYNEFNNPKWLENKKNTLDHKLKLKQQTLFIQQELLNRINSVVNKI